MSVYDWSTTAGDNSNADANINWAEGQNSNTVNNSARAMMAAIAAFIEVISGKTTSGGSGGAYTFTSPAGFAPSAYTDGLVVGFIANHSNAGAATLNVDGLGAKSLRKYGSTLLVADEIESGNMVLAVYDGANFQVLSQIANDNVEAFSALTSASDKLAYFNGASSMATADFTALARSLIAAGTDAGMRTVLGLGALAVKGSVNNADWSGADLAVANGGTGASDASGARTNLGLGAVAVKDNVNNDDWAGADLAVANGGTGASNAADARTGLGLGAVAVLDNVNNSNWSGEDLAVANGGTGASTASGARAGLGIPENTRAITYGTAAPGALANGQVYLRHD